jgi:hypothetical protein
VEGSDDDGGVCWWRIQRLDNRLEAIGYSVLKKNHIQWTCRFLVSLLIWDNRIRRVNQIFRLITVEGQRSGKG